MQTTMDLLAKALESKPATEWCKELKLSRNALGAAKHRGNLSPSIAWAIAESLGENPQAWALIAAAEGERESACRTHMLKRIAQFGTVTALTAAASAAHAAVYIMLIVNRVLERVTTRSHVSNT